MIQLTSKSGEEMSDLPLNETLYPSEDERKAFQQLLRIFSRKDYSLQELTHKLVEKGIDPSIAQKAIEKLLHLGLYNEDNILHNLVRRHASKGNAPKAILYLLRAQGFEVDKEKVESIYHNLSPESRLEVVDFLAKKMKSRDKDPKTREYLLRQALNKGYSFDEAKKAIEKFIPSPF